jgi:cytochrome P450
MATPEDLVTLAELEDDPHPALARMRAAGPAVWVPALGSWMVTGYEAAVAVLRDARTFTVDDPRFSTAKVTGPSMLSLDGAEHARHRAPFNRAFRRDEVHARLAAFTRAEAGRLVAAIEAAGAAELRRAVAGPLATAVMAEVLGLGRVDPGRILAWYDGIVAAVQAEAAGAAGQSEAAGAAGQSEAAGAALPSEAAGAALPSEAAGAAGLAGTTAFGELAASLRQVIAARESGSLLAEVALPPRAAGAALQPEAAGAALQPEAAGAAGPVAEAALTATEAISNAAVLLFGGIETTEGMIANALLHLLSSPAQLTRVIADPGLVPAAVEESLRLEPAAAVVDRYATATTRLGDAEIQAGDQVTVSIAGANRDPAVFGDPDLFDVRRPNAGRQLAFAHGPHFCLGAHLARLEAQIAVETILSRLPRLRLDPRYSSTPRGLVFRKPPDLRTQWDAAS